jgi:VanZ family protein
MRILEGHPQHSVRRPAVWLLVITVGFILYASFYPFEIDLGRARSVIRETLALSLDWKRIPKADLIGNLLFYLPLGALLTYVLPNRWRVATRWLVAVALGCALSITVECLQLATRTRDPALSDVVLNALSTCIGALALLLARRVGMNAPVPELRGPQPDPVSFIVVALWLAFHAAPFMPSYRFFRPLHNAGSLLSGQWTLADAAGYCAGFILVGAALRSLLRESSYAPMLAVAIGVSLLARVIFRGQHLELNELLGLALAAPVLWRFADYNDAHAYLRGELVAGAALIFFALAPFSFVPRPFDFEWTGELHWTYRAITGEPGLLELAFLSIGFVWLASEAGQRLGRIVPALVAGSMVVEIVESWQPGKAAHLITPCLIIVGALLVRIRTGALRRTIPA